MDHPAEGRDARAGGHEDVVVGLAVGRQQEPLAGRARHLDHIARLAVAEEVAADAEEQAVVIGVVAGSLGLALVDEPLDRGAQHAAMSILAVAGAGDRVQADLVWLAVRIRARRHDAEALACQETPLERGAADVDAHVANHARRLALGAERRRRDDRVGGCGRWHQVHGSLGHRGFVHGGMVAHGRSDATRHKIIVNAFGSHTGHHADVIMREVAWMRLLNPDVR